MGLGRFWIVLLWLIVCAFSAIPTFAIDSIAKDPQNSRWHVSEKTGTATFLGGDKAESAILILNKTAVLGQTVSVSSDGAYIVLQSGSSPHVIFQVPRNPDGAVSKILLTGGDQPSLFFNDKEIIQQQGKWMQILAAQDSTIRLEIGTATFATAKFELAAAANPPVVAVAPVKAAPVVKELLHTISPTDLSGACHSFDQGVSRRCSRCDGTGHETYRIQTGTRQDGSVAWPVYEDRKKICEKCHGTGIDRCSNEVLVKLAGYVVKDLAFVNQTDSRTQDVLTKTYTEITDKMIGDQKTWVALTANGKSILAQPKPVTGTTVVSLVDVERSIREDDNHRRFLVRVIGTDKEVYVDDPTLADELNTGHALMGGMVAQPIDDDKIAVLHGGFLIAPAVSHDWWWWYRERE